MSPRSAFEEYRSIVLQRTFYQLQFWHLRLYIVYNTTYSGSRVILTGHCTYLRSQKYIICIQALPVKRFIRSLVWRPLFLIAYTRSMRTKTLSNSAWLLNQVIIWANMVKTHKVYNLSWLCLKWKLTQQLRQTDACLHIRCVQVLKGQY